MESEVTISDQTLAKLQASGEVQAVDSHGVTVVLMTVDARQQLQSHSYDDSEWTDEEQNALLAAAIDDPEGMGAPGMEVYDKMYGHLFDGEGEDQ